MLSSIVYHYWSLEGYSPQGHKELDTTEQLYFTFTYINFQRNNNKLQTDQIILFEELKYQEYHVNSYWKSTVPGDRLFLTI